MAEGALGNYDGGRFCRRFLAFGALSFMIAALLPGALLEPVCRNTAAAAGLLLRLCGMPATTAGTILTVGAFPAVIIPECTPLFMAALFGAFVLAAPAPAVRKLPGLVGGIAVLTALDIIRIAVSVAVGSSRPLLFTCVHTYLGQAVMLCATWAVCTAWLGTVLDSPLPEKIPAFLVRFAAFSSLLFIAWLPVSGRYIRCGDAIVGALLSLAGISLDISYHREVYFQTFTLTSFTALVLAARTLSPRRKAAGILAGLALLFATHLLFRWCAMLLALPGRATAFVSPAALNTIAVFMNVAGELLIPAIILLAVFSTGKKETAITGAPPP